MAQAQTTEVGPGETRNNTGDLTSNDTSAPVVRMTGDSTFNNSGTVDARSNRLNAIVGDAGAQSVNFESGRVVGAVSLGAGDDNFVMSGGIFDGAFSAGSGNDTATLRGLNSQNWGKAAVFDGGAIAGGTDTLILDTVSSIPSRRIMGWNNVNLTNGSSIKMDSNLELVGGTLTIDPTSRIFAGNNSFATIQSVAGSTLTVVNAGGISLRNGEDVAGDTLTIRGNYVGQNGYLNLHTVLGTDGSASDRLIIDGGAVSGTTRISIQNVGGLGAATVGDGIEVVSGINGGTTTATTTGTGFVLEGGHVDAGAFEYRLFASNQAGTSESWYLRTNSDDQTGGPDPDDPTEPTNPTDPTDPGTPGGPGDDPTAIPTYRVEAPLLAALPNTLRSGDLTMLATLHRRIGDDGRADEGFSVPGRLWGRAIYEDARFRQRGDVRPTTDGRSYGFQLGLDVFRYRSGERGQHSAGLYGGYLNGRYDVRGFASGIENNPVGRLRPKTYYAGAYWTYKSDTGFYADLVLQHSWYRGRAEAVNGNRAGIRGTGMLVSLETGYGFALSPNWKLEPQAQVIGQSVSINDVAIPAANVNQFSNSQVTGRLGLRLTGSFGDEANVIEPYLRANVWKAFESHDGIAFVTPAATTVLDTRNGALWGDAGGGLTWRLNGKMSIYGEVTHRFTLRHSQGATGRSTGGSLGLKIKL